MLSVFAWICAIVLIVVGFAGTLARVAIGVAMIVIFLAALVL